MPSTFLLLWNPSRFHFADLPRFIDELDAGRFPDDSWSTGVRKAFPIGSTVFLLRVGVEPRGIVGHGITTAEPFVGEHWANAASARYVPLRWLSLIDPEYEQPLRTDGLPIPQHIQGGGVTIDEEAAAIVAAAWQEHAAPAALPTALEGTETIALRKHRRREKRLRAAKVASAATLDCEVCDLPLSRHYGELAARIIEVHHLTPLDQGERTTTMADLALVCPTCHRYIHATQPMPSIVEARQHRAAVN